MKKILALFAVTRISFFVLVLLLCVGGTATAQKARSNRSKPKAKPQPQKVERLKTIAVYEVDTRYVSILDGALLYAEDNKNNPLVLIYNESGKAVDWIKGKANVYEDARPTIDRVYPYNNCIVLKTYKELQGIKWLVWDGKSELENCRVLESWDEVKGGNGRYVFIVNKKAGYELWDMDELKCLYSWKPYNTYMPEYGANSGPLYIASDFGVWYQKGNGVDTGPRLLSIKDDRFYDFPLSGEKYIKNNGVNNFSRIRHYNDYVYVACGRRIYRMNMLSPGQWEEFLKIPSTIDNEVNNFCITPNGNVLVIGKRVELYRSGAFDIPQLLGYDEKINTGLKQYAHQTLWLSLSNICTDDKGNFVIYIDKTIYIYNPDGIVGYTETYGKVTDFR